MPSPDLRDGTAGSPARAGSRSFFAGPAARTSALAACLLVGVATLVGALRMGPVLLAANVPVALAAALGREVIGVALETALLVSPAIGLTLAASRLVARGEARALFAIGVRPLRVVATAWPLLVATAGVEALAAFSWGRTAAAPGTLVQAMIDDARASCDGVSGAIAVRAVPLAGAAWICSARGPRLVAFPADGAGNVLSASRVAVSPDLRAVDATDVDVLARTASGPVTVHVERASLRGLPAIRRASNLGAASRALLLAGTTLALAVVAAVAALSSRRGSPAHALVLGACGPAAALLVFGALEARSTEALVYACVPLAGALAVGLARASLR